LQENRRFRDVLEAKAYAVTDSESGSDHSLLNCRGRSPTDWSRCSGGEPGSPASGGRATDSRRKGTSRPSPVAPRPRRQAAVCKVLAPRAARLPSSPAGPAETEASEVPHDPAHGAGALVVQRRPPVRGRLAPVGRRPDPQRGQP